MLKPESLEGRQRVADSTRPCSVLATGAELVELAERSVCGCLPVTTASAALGIALAGSPAATLDAPDVQLAAGPTVHHLDDFEKELPSGVWLAAGSHQTVVNNVLLAHRLAACLQSPVFSLMPPSIRQKLGWAALPDAGHPNSAIGPPSDDPLRAVENVYSEAGRSLSLPPAPFCLYGEHDAATLLITAGAFEKEAARLVDRLKEPVLHLSISLVRPFLGKRIEPLLAKRSNVILVGPEGSRFHAALLEDLRSLRTDGPIEFLPVPFLPAGADGEQEALARALSVRLTLRDEVGPQEAGEGCNLGLTPGGIWARDVLRRIGTALATSCPDDSVNEAAGAGFSTLGLGRKTDAPFDLLIILENDLLDPTPAVKRLKPGGMVLYQSSAADPLEAWSRLPRVSRARLQEQEAQIWWIGSADGGVPRNLAGFYATLVVDLAVRLLAKGAASADEVILEPIPDYPVEMLDPGLLESALSRREPDFMQGDHPPRMAAQPEEADPKWREALRDFHLTGGPLGIESAWDPDLPLIPAVGPELVAKAAGISAFPYYLPDGSDSAEAGPFGEMLDAATGEDGESGVIRRLLPAIIEVAGREGSPHRPPREVLETAIAAIGKVVELSPEGRRRFESESATLSDRLPAAGIVQGFEASGWVSFLHSAARCDRPRLLGSTLDEINSLIVALEEVLLADDRLSERARSPEAVQDRLGEAGRLLDPAGLARNAPRLAGSQGLSPERRTRIERTVKDLKAFLSGLSEWPALHLVHASGSPLPALPEGIQPVEVTGDPFELAAGLFDGMAGRVVEGVRALRTARLEVEGAFDERVHGAAIERLTWEGFENPELALVPAVVVFESSERLARRGLTSFNRLLRSGRPVRVILTAPESLLDPTSRNGGVLPDFGYLSIAHREAFVLQCALSRPEMLLEGLRRVVTSTRPAVAVIAVPQPGDDPDRSWQRWVIAGHARSLPAFVYDPVSGSTWAERFHLEGDPEPDAPWVSVPFRVTTPGQGPGVCEEKVTYAHMAAMDPLLRRHFAVVPTAAWGSDLVPLAEYLEDYVETPPETLPYIWVIDSSNNCLRAVVTREMAVAARDRQQNWRTLQELAGIRNAHVDRALREQGAELTARLREEAEKQVAAARLEGATEAIDRIVELLTLGTAVPAPKTVKRVAAREIEAEVGAPLERVESPAGEETETETDQAAAEELEEELLEEPYIDSFLCTSCNECINLNPRMFKYNHDKQAYLADLETGTFAQLVKAAEACPAKCIHPGSPRPNDSTATPEMVERAKVFS